MSVLIKGMEMPKKKNGAVLIIYPDGRCAFENGKEYKAVPVQPHGKLIDADELLKLLDSCMFPSDMVTTRALSMATNWLKEAPTIIEAEE